MTCQGMEDGKKESNRARGTHSLETAERGICQDMERRRMGKSAHYLETAQGGTCQAMETMRPNEMHSLPEDRRGRDLSGHIKKVTERGSLTSWKPQRGRGLVRI